MDAASTIADLDADQRAAVTTESILVAVVAGAGSGKTRVLTRRIAYRIFEGTAEARHTLALTFTREAAGELRKRLSRLGLREQVEAGTFHSVMLSVLRQRWTDQRRPHQTVVTDRWRLIRDALAGMPEVEGGHRGLEGLVNEVSWATARGLRSEAYVSEARRSGRRPAAGIEPVADLLRSFAELKRRRGILEFDDVLENVIREMESDVDFADGLRWRYRHLLVDEAQDLNPLQHRLVDLLRQDRDDLFLVGDPSQAIYGFNGADPTLLVEVEERFPGIEVVRLPTNHRSTSQIVNAGSYVLSASAQAADIASGRGEGQALARRESTDDEREADEVAADVVGLDPNLIRTGEIAILARTNAQLHAFESALAARGVAVRRSGSAATGLAAVVREVASSTSAGRLRAWAHDTLDRIDDLTTARAEVDASTPELDARRTRLGVDLDQLENERRVALAVLDYLRDVSGGDGAGFRAWVAINDPFGDRSREGVELLSFHASKGREWHTVFVTGIESGLMPYRLAKTAAARAEEARLLYVAFTRATDRLIITSAARRRGYVRTPSPFIDGLDLSESPVAPPPSSLVRRRRAGNPLLVALRRWRADAAKAAGTFEQLILSDRDLASVAAKQPRTPDELTAVTTLGSITAERLAPQIADVIGEHLENQSRSTMTGA